MRFAKAMAARTDDELITVVTGAAADWEPEALEDAEAEIARRGLVFERPEAAAIEAVTGQADARASAPLEPRMKLVAFLLGFFLTALGGIIGLGVMASWTRRGERRRGSDFLLWTAAGFAASFVLLSLLR